MTCTHKQWLRDDQPSFETQREDRYVIWGEGSTDEMCLGHRHRHAPLSQTRRYAKWLVPAGARDRHARRMTVHVHNLTFDCVDSRALAGFWSTLTGWNLYYDDDPEVIVAPSFPYDGTGFLFIPVPEGKTAKNRLHLDLSPDQGTRDELVEVAVGCRRDHRGGPPPGGRHRAG